MTALLIILMIVLLFVLILSLRLKLYIRLDDTLYVSAGLGPVLLSLLPRRYKRKSINLEDFSYKKHQKRLKHEQKIAQKKIEKSNKKKFRKTLDDADKTVKSEAEGKKTSKLSLDAIIEIICFILEEFPKLTASFITEIRMLEINVAGRDASDCAVKYGIISQSVAYLVEILDSSTRMKPLKQNAIVVKSDFLKEKSSYKIDIRLKVSLFSLLKSGVRSLVWLIKSDIIKI